MPGAVTASVTGGEPGPTARPGGPAAGSKAGKTAEFGAGQVAASAVETTGAGLSSPDCVRPGTIVCGDAGLFVDGPPPALCAGAAAAPVTAPHSA